MSEQYKGNLIPGLEQMVAEADKLVIAGEQATAELKAVCAEIPAERLQKLVFDLEQRLFGRRGGSADGSARRELIAGVERGCK